MRWFALAYAVGGYVLAVRTMLYLVGFLGNVLVRKTVDAGSQGRAAVALAVDLLLLAAFAVSHSFMARRPFKRRIATLVPEPLERATYVWTSALSLAVLIGLWRPVPGIVWSTGSASVRWTLTSLFWAGWALALISSRVLGHPDLYGLRQAYRYARGRAYSPAALKTKGLYGVARHPMYAGFVLGLWSTPRMTSGHLLFAAGMTAYLVIGARYEERDLATRFGAPYHEYRRRVRIFPWPRGPEAVHAAGSATGGSGEAGEGGRRKPGWFLRKPRDRPGQLLRKTSRHDRDAP